MKLKKSQLKELIKHAIVDIMSEDDSDKYTHIGYGRYKEKGKEKDKNSPTFKKNDAGKIVPFDGDDVGGPAHPNVKKKRKVKESTRRKYTIKEVRMWMKKLEENRYKKVYNSDARRVAWMVNNEGVDLQEMPVSMRKKWSKAAYGRERYLAREFLKSKSKVNEQKLRELVRKVIIKEIRG